jgi:predicted protein tyrosine phosphatase
MVGFLIAIIDQRKRRFDYVIARPAHLSYAGPLAVSVQKLLFVCSRNKRRSLTAEKFFEGFSAYRVRSAGTQPGARIVITEGHLGWADIIFVMEKSHLNRLRQKYPEALQGKRIITLHIPDDYELMQPELIDELRCKLGPHVMLPDEFRDAY